MIERRHTCFVISLALLLIAFACFLSAMLYRPQIAAWLTKTPTPTRTPLATMTLTPTKTPSPTPTSSETPTPVPTPTQAPTPTPTPGTEGADLVVAYKPGPGAETRYRDPQAALGAPDLVESPCCQGMVQLGRKGSLLLAFTNNTIVDGDGPDFQVFGESLQDDFILVEISEDGLTWFAYAKVSESPGALDLAGTGLARVVYVRLTDWQPATTSGAEIDAAVALHSGPGSGNDLPNLSDLTEE